VLIREDGTVLGLFNQRDLEDGTAVPRLAIAGALVSIGARPTSHPNGQPGTDQAVDGPHQHVVEMVQAPRHACISTELQHYRVKLSEDELKILNWHPTMSRDWVGESRPSSLSRPDRSA
jgi:hypothetical protein